MRAFGNGVLLVMLLAACERAPVRARLVSKIPRELQLSLQDSVRGRLPEGGLLMWLDREACESCLGLDLEARAMVERMPHLPLLVITTSDDKTAVSEFFSRARLTVPILSINTDVWNASAPVQEGGVTLELLSNDGRVLSALQRTAGGQRPLLAEDLEQLVGMVTGRLQ